jgi:hypothetical protein
VSDDNITNIDDYRAAREPTTIGIGTIGSNILILGEPDIEIVISKGQAYWLANKLLDIVHS